tara:strand:+ start:133 stop:609 length:477 start_codon:yes stop_codon:yes gene_type:complete
MQLNKTKSNPIFHFSIPGVPIPQKRHRHTTAGKFVRTYDPSKEDKEIFFSQCIEQTDMKYYHSVYPLSHMGYISVSIFFCMPIPKSTSKKKTLELLDFVTYHTKRPDIDNLIKFVLDALSGQFWKDDSLVAQIDAHKIYAMNPRTDIQIIYKDGLQNG